VVHSWRPATEFQEALRSLPASVEWLKEHRTELLVGTVAVMAGVTFVVVSAGAGLVVLAPLALMASAGSTNAPLCPGDGQ